MYMNHMEQPKNTDSRNLTQRAFTRIPFRHELRWSDTGQDSGEASSYDISRGGLCLALPRYLRPGHELQIHIDDIFYESEPIRFNARVAWCAAKANKSNVYTAGIQVLHDLPETLAVMSEVFYQAVDHLRKEDPPYPATFDGHPNRPSLAS